MLPPRLEARYRAGMHVLLVGGGGREHAIAWMLAKSPHLSALTLAPGNPGIADLTLLGGGRPSCAPVAADDVAGLEALAVERAADLVVVGPEVALAAGLADRLGARGIAVFGPVAAAARLESSKAFSKAVMQAAGVPTARAGVFHALPAAVAFLDTLSPPYVIKADGLAAGKGVVISDDRAEAEREIAGFLSGRFGDASRTLLLEEFMAGEEASVFALTDGESVRLLPPAQDHKRAFDRDQGPNTGGMGAYAPAGVVTPEILRTVEERIVRPVLDHLRAQGAVYRGVLFVGLMITAGGPKVVEFNCRFGDPETQAILPCLDVDLLPILDACARGGLAQAVAPGALETPARAAATVVLATRGYPGSAPKGSILRGLDRAAASPGALVFHAGTARSAEGAVTAAGGRVLNITGVGPDLPSAIARAYAAVDAVDWPEGFHRRDIGRRALAGAAP